MYNKYSRLQELIYFTIGVVFHLIGGISGVIRANYIEDIDEVDATRSEFKIGILLLGNSISYILLKIIFIILSFRCFKSFVFLFFFQLILLCYFAKLLIQVMRNFRKRKNLQRLIRNIYKYIYIYKKKNKHSNIINILCFYINYFKINI